MKTGSKIVVRAVGQRRHGSPGNANLYRWHVLQYGASVASGLERGKERAVFMANERRARMRLK